MKYLYLDTSGKRTYQNGNILKYWQPPSEDQENTVNTNLPKRSPFILILHWTDYKVDKLIRALELQPIEKEDAVEGSQQQPQKKSVIIFISGGSIDDEEKYDFDEAQRLLATNCSADVFFQQLDHGVDVEDKIGSYLNYIAEEQQKENQNIIGPEKYYNNYIFMAFEALLQTALISIGQMPDELRAKIEKTELKNIHIDNMKSFWDPVAKPLKEILSERNNTGHIPADDKLIECAKALRPWWENGCSEQFELFIFNEQNKKSFVKYIEAWKNKIQQF